MGKFVQAQTPNVTARKIRHQKLFGTPYPFWNKFFCRKKKKNAQHRKPIVISEQDVIETRENEGQVYEKKFNADLNYINPLLYSHFYTKVSALIVGIFLFSSIAPTYAYEEEFSEDFNIFAKSQPASFKEKKIATTQDGFIVHTSGQTEIGDRSNISDPIVYEVKQGDTLSGIAHKFHIKIQTIVWNNNIINTNILKPGQQLTILPVDGLLHTVASKDTLDKIAKEYKIDKATITKQNKLSEEKVIAETQLIIPGAKRTVPRYIAMSRGYQGQRGSTNIGKILKAGSFSNTFTGGGTVALVKPCAGRYTQFYHRGHYAVDIASSNKGPIYASATGKVVKASFGWNGGYGNVIIVDHGGGVKTLYAHNEALYVKIGEVVSQGQTIAWMGRTGRVYGRTGIHLHFEVIIGGVKKNPLAYFK